MGAISSPLGIGVINFKDADIVSVASKKGSGKQVFIDRKSDFCKAV